MASRGSFGTTPSYGYRVRELYWPLVGLIVLLNLIGIAMLYSAAKGNMDPWASRQMARFLVMVPVMVIIALVDIQFWVRIAYWLYGFGVVLLVVVEIMGFVGMGAQRWVNVGGMNFQPSEYMKVALVLALARYYHFVHGNEINRLMVMAPVALLMLVPAALILKQPNLGTASILLMTGAGVMFLAGITWKLFAVGIVGAVSSVPLIWHFLHDYQKRRVYTFLDPESDPLGAGYNIMQSKIAIGSGEFFGKGFLEGSQSQLNFLPEKQTDFIFTMLAEEFGMMGGVTILFFYALLIFMGFRIALVCRNQFGRLVAGGVSAVMFIHLFINVAMVMGLIPVVGVPLPFLSYGGSVLIAMMVGYGFVLNAYVYRDVTTFRGVRDLL